MGDSEIELQKRMVAEVTERLDERRLEMEKASLEAERGSNEELAQVLEELAFSISSLLSSNLSVTSATILFCSSISESRCKICSCSSPILAYRLSRPSSSLSTWPSFSSFSSL